MSTAEPRHFILATAGHVDHGKSALVKALTGTDPDRLPEEKARGITIDLGFAHLQLSTLDPRPSTFDLGIVDVPGHEDFVKNMVAGVGSIDLALFIVAADDGWMPQTEEHLQILAYLGVEHAVVALTKIDLCSLVGTARRAVRERSPQRGDPTKIDLAESGEETVIAAVREHLQNSPFAEAEIIPTSVISGRGLDDLKAALTRELARTPPPRDFGKPRLPVDRVFTLRGIGTVVTGTLNGGELQRGQAVLIQPRGRPSRIRSVQNHNHDVQSSPPGTRTALNLPDVAADQAGDQTDGIRRGDVVTLPSLGAASNTLDVLLEKSSRLAGEKTGVARPLKDGALVRIHHGSGNFPARVQFFAGGPLKPGERLTAQLRAESPVFAFVGDRFIVRDWAEQTTLAGGIVLDADADRRQFRSEARQEFLAARAQSPNDLPTLIQSQVTRDGAVHPSKLLLKSRFSTEEISQAAARLAAVAEVGDLGHRVLQVGDWLADTGFWNNLRERAMAAIDAEHKAHPEQAGLPLSGLRAALEPLLPAPALFDPLLAELCRNGFAQTGVAIRRASHRPTLPPHLQAAGARLRTALAAKPLEPPSRKELAPDSISQQALRFLIQTGEAVDLGEEVALSSDAFARAKEIVRQFLAQHRSATVSDLRQALGSSRRIVVPLLERLDREGFTRREGDKRTLRKTQNTI